MQITQRLIKLQREWQCECVSDGQFVFLCVPSVHIQSAIRKKGSFSIGRSGVPQWTPVQVATPPSCRLPEYFTPFCFVVIKPTVSSTVHATILLNNTFTFFSSSFNFSQATGFSCYKITNCVKSEMTILQSSEVQVQVLLRFWILEKSVLWKIVHCLKMILIHIRDVKSVAIFCAGFLTFQLMDIIW